MFTGSTATIPKWRVAAIRGPAAPPQAVVPQSAAEALRAHWRLYLYEGAELAWFMAAACVATVLLFGAGSVGAEAIPSATLRRLAMGVAMGVTAVLIIHSPMGRRSGAHFNPAITLTYLRLGRIGRWDALFYVLGQFAGGIGGVGVAALLLGSRLSQPAVEYAVTVPGVGGTAGAFAAELFMAALLMGLVLVTSNRPRWAPWTSYLVGLLIVNYIFFFAPVSGFSINPARTVGSALFANVWTAGWVYFAAPLLGMMGAAEVYVWRYGLESVLCAKLHPASSELCLFECRFPGHRIAARDAGSDAV